MPFSPLSRKVRGVVTCVRVHANINTNNLEFLAGINHWIHVVKIRNGLSGILRGPGETDT